MPSADNERHKRISVDLPVDLVNRFDQLKDQWGYRRRGAVLERLLEEIFDDDEMQEIINVYTKKEQEEQALRNNSNKTKGEKYLMEDES